MIYTTWTMQPFHLMLTSLRVITIVCPGPALDSRSGVAHINSSFQCLVDTYLCNLLAPVLVNHVITHTYKLAMSYKISGSRLQEETAFAKRYLDQISEHAVNYADDFVTPPEKRPRRMPVLAVSKE
jgi:hypothetical protein